MFELSIYNRDKKIHMYEQDTVWTKRFAAHIRTFFNCGLLNDLVCYLNELSVCACFILFAYFHCLYIFC